MYTKSKTFVSIVLFTLKCSEVEDKVSVKSPKQPLLHLQESSLTFLGAKFWNYFSSALRIIKVIQISMEVLAKLIDSGTQVVFQKI